MLIATGLLMLGATVITAQGDGASQGDGARFTARSELVVLNVAVTDGRGGFVSGLSRDAFQVFENGSPQKVSFFAEQDAPATIGLLIDSSGSMLANRDRVIAGITSLAQASHPDDEFLPLVFNDYVMPVLSSVNGFTRDPAELRDALTKNLNVLGRTALHDALSVALDGVGRGTHERRVLIVLSDGGDNASQLSFDDALEKVQASNVVIYTIALLDPVALDRSPGRCGASRGDWGLAFEPRNVMIPRTFRTIADDIRSRTRLPNRLTRQLLS
jgi:VWFA-related protein